MKEFDLLLKMIVIFLFCVIKDDLVQTREENEVLKQKLSELAEQLNLQTKLVSDMKDQRDNALRANVNKRLKRNGKFCISVITLKIMKEIFYVKPTFK